MKRQSLAIIGFGKLGRACAESILESDDLTLAGIVRQPSHVPEKLPERFSQIPVVPHIRELQQPVDGALICLPTNLVLGTARELMQQRIPIVECATLHGEDMHNHRTELHRLADNYKAKAIVGAGWDPGALSIFRSLFAVMTPKGHSEISHRPGVALHHTSLARTVSGVKDALATELQGTDGTLRRYVYVELEHGADFSTVERAIRSDPLFLDEPTLVFPVDDVAELEEEEQGVLVQCRGISGLTSHQYLLLEARFDEATLAAQVMLAASRALPYLRRGGYSLLDIPLGTLWGERREQADITHL